MNIHKLTYLRSAWLVGVLILLNTMTAQAVTPACGTLLTTDTTLDSDMNCSSTALSFSGPGGGSNDITLDCAGFSINTTSGTAVLANFFVSGITIKNCSISASGPSAKGILLTQGTTNSLITNNTVTASDFSARAINIRGEAHSNMITGNTLHTTGTNKFGNALRIRDANNNIAMNNTIQADVGNAVDIQSASNNEIIGNTLISQEGWIYHSKFYLQNGGLSVDNAGNIYAVENDWGSSAYQGTATAFFLVDPITGFVNSVIPLLEDGSDVGFGFDALDILPNGRFLAFGGGASQGGSSSIYEINPNTGEVTTIELILPVLAGTPNGLEATSDTSLLATTNKGELLSIDLNTNSVTVIGQQGTGWTGLAIHPTSGKAYTVSRRRDETSNTAHLYEIDLNTGLIISEIGDTGESQISDIDFAPDGTLYGNNWLVVIDPITGLSTPIGGFGPDPLEPLPQNNRIEDNVMQTADGSIQFTGSITLPAVAETDISRSQVDIGFNEARVDSTALPFLDAPARITLTGLPGSSRSLLVDPEDDGSFVPCLSPQCTLVSFSGGELIFDVTGFSTYSSISEPEPDIKANDSDGPLQIAFGTPLRVDVSLESNDATGEAADWWLVAEAPDGRYWYDLSGSWVKSMSPIPTYGGALFDIESMTVLDSSNLPPGSYSIHFGVDTNANGILDFDVLFIDTVDVTIQ